MKVTAEQIDQVGIHSCKFEDSRTLTDITLHGVTDIKQKTIHLKDQDGMSFTVKKFIITDKYGNETELNCFKA